VLHCPHLKEVAMTRTRRPFGPLVLLVVFLVGVTTGFAAAAKLRVASTLYAGKPPAQAATTLLETAEPLAEEGSWELIFVGRTRYLSGDRAGGQAIFDRVLNRRKVEPGDFVRVGRVYREAGEWDRARDMFERTLAAAPNDADWLAEIGAWYNLAGDRARAEELFGRSLAEDDTNLYNAVKMAGSYVGVTPG
jgi:tetratricopeptide (TPR) repeat protein